jgi:hypothetical protein
MVVIIAIVKNNKSLPHAHDGRSFSIFEKELVSCL